MNDPSFKRAWDDPELRRQPEEAPEEDRREAAESRLFNWLLSLSSHAGAALFAGTVLGMAVAAALVADLISG